MFGVEPVIKTQQMNSDLSDRNYPQLDELVERIIKVLPEPNLDFIDPDNISQSVKKSIYNNYNYGYDYDDYAGYDDPSVPLKKDGKFTPDQKEIDYAFEMGYDIQSNSEDREEWNAYRDYFYSEHINRNQGLL